MNKFVPHPNLEMVNESSEDSNTSKHKKSHGETKKKIQIKTKVLSNHFLHWKGKEPIIKILGSLNMQGLMNEIISSF